MQITKEALLARLASLKDQHAQLEANAHATSGAIQDCEHWLKELQKDSKPEPSKLSKVE